VYIGYDLEWSRTIFPIKDLPMADDTNLVPALETPSSGASSAPKEKKMRAPRKPKAAAEAVADTLVSTPAKKSRGPGKKPAATITPVAAEPAAKTPAAKTPAAKKATAGKAQPAKRSPKQVDAAPVYTDGFSDLLKLEEENQTLRKALSEKLRAENADLRKKLGTA
jgi:putative transposase